MEHCKSGTSNLRAARDLAIWWSIPPAGTFWSGSYVEADRRPQYAVTVGVRDRDARFFRGIIYLRDRGDPAAAIPEFQLYLAARPDGPQSDAVRQLLAGAVAATSGDVPSSTTTPR